MSFRVDRLLWGCESYLISELLKRRGVMIQSGVRFVGIPIIVQSPRSQISIARHARFISVSRRTPLGIAHKVVLRTLLPGALLRIGEDVGMSGGSICAASMVSIGKGCLLGADVAIMDTNFHPIHSGNRRYAEIPEPKTCDAVIVGSNVFIGTRATILAGSVIGDHCVIGAGAVVKGHFSEGSIIVGNPATVVGHVKP